MPHPQEQTFPFLQICAVWLKKSIESWRLQVRNFVASQDSKLIIIDLRRRFLILNEPVDSTTSSCADDSGW